MVVKGMLSSARAASSLGLRCDGNNNNNNDKKNRKRE